jgi:hypothetical protein
MRTEKEIKKALEIQEYNAAEELKSANKTTGSIKQMHTRRYNVFKEKAGVLRWVLQQN